MLAPFHIPRPQAETLKPVDGMSPVARALSLDLIVVIYVLATITIVLAQSELIPHAERVALAHAGGLLVYAIFRWGLTGWLVLRILYIVSLIALVLGIFQGMGHIIPHIHADAVANLEADSVLAGFDVRLFGEDPTTWFFPLLTPFTVVVLQICYASYFLLALVVIFTLVLKRRYRSFLSWIAVIVGCFFTTYVGYYLAPAYGPRVFYEYAQPIPHTDVSRWIYDTLDSLDLIKLNAFPSGHTAVTIVYQAILFYEARRIAWLFLPVTIGLIIATLALRYHYMVDVIAGLFVAGLWIPWGARLVFHFDHRPPEDGVTDVP